MSGFKLEKHLPFKSCYADIAGYKMHYIDEGSGPVVVMLHGNPTWCFYFRRLVEALKGKYRVIVPDYIGCGLSDHPAVSYRATERIEQVSELLEKLGVKKFSLLMHDWGGPIGTGVAVRDPSRIEKLIYLNTTLTEVEALPLIIKASASRWIGKYLTQTTNRFLKVTTQWGVTKKLPREIKAGYFFPYQTKERRRAIWDFVQDIPFDSDHKSYSELLEIASKITTLQSKPVKIIWGLKDPCFHRGMLAKVSGHFPRASVLEIPDASHLVLEDAPEIVVPAVEDFLQNGSVMPSSFEVNSGGPRTVYSAFVEASATNPRVDAVVTPKFVLGSAYYNRTSFKDLGALVRQYERGLTKYGLAAGDRIVMLVPPGADFLALALAVMGRGAIPVFLDPGMGIDNLVASIRQCDPQGFIGSPKANLLRFKIKDIFKRLKFSVIAADILLPGVLTTGFLRRFSPAPLLPVEASAEQFIAFTSGGTGAPKGVVYTPKMLDGILKIFERDFGMQAGGKDMPMLPIFSLFNVALGITSVFPPMNPSKPLELDPAKICTLVDELGIQSSFGSPTLWTKLGEYALRHRVKLPSLKRVFMAGAPVSSKTLKLVKDVIATDGEAYTPYGATEALPVTLVSSKEVLSANATLSRDGELGTFVGRPVSGVEMKIIENVEGAIATSAEMREVPAMTIGEIVVSGENISSQYFRQDIATHNSKIVDASGRLWHRMGDMGYADEKGNLYFCGRKVHRVVTESKVFYSIPVERVFNESPKVRRSALIPYQGMPAIVVEPKPEYWPDGKEQQEAFRRELIELAAKNKLTHGITDIFFHRSFPVDARHNAKIFRDRLAQWASKEAAA